MKNALILHGTGDDHSKNWFPWLQKKLEKKGYKVWTPDLPSADRPNIRRYNKFLLNQNHWDFDQDSILIGHSAGAVAILGLLQALPENAKVQACYLVGAFKNDLGWDALSELFTDPLKFDLIKKKSNRFVFIHSDDDPYCPLDHAEYLSDQLDGELFVKKGQKHFSVSTDSKKYRKFPFLLKSIEDSNSISQPNNKSTKENPVGRFMVAVGGIIELRQTGKILLLQRANHLDWHPNEWEIPYGRLDQFEDSEAGLKREIREEVGIKDLQIIDILSTWHIFRGSRETAENELIGITYHCRTDESAPTLSCEHQGYKWVSPQEALSLISIDGIRKDIEKYLQKDIDFKSDAGKKYIGVGVGALIFNDRGELLLSLRGKDAKNERGKWEIPGGSVEFGERIIDALKREIKEEIDVEIEIEQLLHFQDHIIVQENQHWVAPTYICKITKGVPSIMEPEKCERLEWFSLKKAQKLPLSMVTKRDVQLLLERGF